MIYYNIYVHISYIYHTYPIQLRPSHVLHEDDRHSVGIELCDNAYRSSLRESLSRWPQCHRHRPRGVSTFDSSESRFLISGSWPALERVHLHCVEYAVVLWTGGTRLPPYDGLARLSSSPCISVAGGSVRPEARWKFSQAVRHDLHKHLILRNNVAIPKQSTPSSPFLTCVYSGHSFGPAERLGHLCDYEQQSRSAAALRLEIDRRTEAQSRLCAACDRAAGVN